MLIHFVAGGFIVGAFGEASGNDAIILLAMGGVVLAYAWRLADNDLSQIAKVCKANGVFRYSDVPPPWNAVGLKRYLLEHGPEGLNTASTWVHSH
jgi:hypothetical protein